MFAEKWNITPFDVLEKDIDDFILIVNQMIKKGGEADTPTANNATAKTKVISNNYDGFWDM